AWSCLSENYKTKYRMKENILKKNFDILDVIPSQKKRKISDNLYSYPQYPTQSYNLIKFIFSCTVPISIVNNNKFRQFCISVGFIPLNSETIRNTIINAYNRTNKLIQTKIIETAKFVALTLDTHSHSYIGITCHWITNDFKLIDVILDVMNFSGDDATELVEKFQLILSKFGLAHENIVSITNDNYNVKVLLTQIKIKIISCLTNILRISIESGLSCINDILNKSKKLIEILSNDTNYQKLRDIQQQIDQNIKQLLDVIDVKEDWNSIYHANCWLIGLQLPIQYLYRTLNNNILGISIEDEILKENLLSDDELDICRELDTILNLFYELIEMLKVSKYPALSFVTSEIENIKQYLSNYQPKNDVIQHLKDNILDNIKKNSGLPSTLGLYGSFFDP
ncbi:3416_t:CDS:1, partial [Cetraspora pellucida]